MLKYKLTKQAKKENDLYSSDLELHQCIWMHVTLALTDTFNMEINLKRNTTLDTEQLNNEKRKYLPHIICKNRMILKVAFIMLKIPAKSYSVVLFCVPVAQWLEHCVSSANVVGSIPREHTY